MTDISRTIIGEALGSYRGTIIAVTHDLEFLKYMKPDTILMMPEGVFCPMILNTMGYYNALNRTNPAS